MQLSMPMSMSKNLRFYFFSEKNDMSLVCIFGVIVYNQFYVSEIENDVDLKYEMSMFRLVVELSKKSM